MDAYSLIWALVALGVMAFGVYMALHARHDPVAQYALAAVFLVVGFLVGIQNTGWPFVYTVVVLAVLAFVTLSAKRGWEWLKPLLQVLGKC